jgi:hypothetical protein
LKQRLGLRRGPIVLELLVGCVGRVSEQCLRQQLVRIPQRQLEQPKLKPKPKLKLKQKQQLGWYAMLVVETQLLGLGQRQLGWLVVARQRAMEQQMQLVEKPQMKLMQLVLMMLKQQQQRLKQPVALGIPQQLVQLKQRRQPGLQHAMLVVEMQQLGLGQRQLG